MDHATLALHELGSISERRIESIVNPDPSRGQYEMSITALIRTARDMN